MTIEEKIQDILDNVVNKQLGLHGGSAVLTKFEDGVVWVKFLGACASCASSEDTLETVVKENLAAQIPEVKDVVLDTSVSQDLLDMARKILNKEI